MRGGLAWVVWLGLSGSAAAQTPGPTEPADTRSLEDQVTAALATRGIALSRHGLELQIERQADVWLVSLVDVTTRRVAASDKVVALPADRETAVTAMTDVAAELAVQRLGAIDAAVPMLEPAPLDPHVVQTKRELEFLHRAIRFVVPDEVAGHGAADRRERWLILRGDHGLELEPEEFFHIVGRDDLAWATIRRRGAAVGSYALAGTSFVIAGVFAAAAGRATCDVRLTPDGHGGCVRIQYASSAPAWIFAGVGTAGVIAGTYLAFRRRPISEDDARALADAYNQRLRRRLGLPPAPRRALLRDVTLTPYAAGRAAGAVLGARF